MKTFCSERVSFLCLVLKVNATVISRTSQPLVAGGTDHTLTRIRSCDSGSDRERGRQPGAVGR
jgi:hypothetical protein